MPGLAKRRLLIVCCLLGATLGAAWQAYRGVAYQATTGVYLPAMPVESGIEPGAESTLDTQARMIAALRPPDMAQNTHSGWFRPADSVTISAEPNTRILDITYRSGNASRAMAAVREIADGTIRQRTARLESEHAHVTHQAQRQAQQVSDALSAIDDVSRVTSDGKLNREFSLSPALREKRSSLEIEQENLQLRLENLATVSITGGQVVQPARFHAQPAQWNVAIGSGAGLGILLAVLVTSLESARGVRLGKLSDAEFRRSFRGLATYRVHSDADLLELQQRFVAGLFGGQILCLGPYTDRTRLVTDTVRQAEGTTAGRPALTRRTRAADPQVIAVVSSSARTSRLADEIARLQRSGIELAGVVIADR